MRRSPSPLHLLFLVPIVALAAACGSDEGSTGGEPETTPVGPGGKTDSGWLGADTYEVNAVIRSTARQEPTGDWAELATDAAVQAQLVDQQIKFIKNTAESHGWRFNQLADKVNVVSVETDANGNVVVKYEAVVDMLGRLAGDVPTLDEIEPRIFAASVPADPVDFTSAEIQGCSKSEDGHSPQDYNFHYYFAPDEQDCAMELTEAEVEVTEVFDRPKVYPEYDKLMQPLEGDRVGFTVALVPNRGDDDPLGRFKSHQDMLVGQLGLWGEVSEDGAYHRYVWDEEGATIVIDLYDPTDVPWSTGFAGAFRERLGQYTLVHYNGHSAYGTQELLNYPEAYSDAYQIIMMHSCQSYAYYTRQVFRAKATDEDPSGFALADVVATGMSSYPNGSPTTVRVLLENLMAGMVAIKRGAPEEAPDWLTITARMKGATWGDIMYGVAGVRTNAWQPPAP